MTQLDWQQKFIANTGYTYERLPKIAWIWWQNPTNQHSLRLTKSGYEWTKKHSKIHYNEVRLSHHLVAKHFLQLERLLKSPYYIKGKSICLVSESDAIMLQLHAGNLAQYLDNLERNT